MQEYYNQFPRDSHLITLSTLCPDGLISLSKYTCDTRYSCHFSHFVLNHFREGAALYSFFPVSAWRGPGPSTRAPEHYAVRPAERFCARWCGPGPAPPQLTGCKDSVHPQEILRTDRSCFTVRGLMTPHTCVFTDGRQDPPPAKR